MERPLFERSYSFLEKELFVIKGIDNTIASYGDDYLSFTEHHLERLFNYLGCDWLKYEQACHSFVLLTFDVLKMYSHYQTRGEISPFSSKNHFEEVYEKQELMQGQYLVGLYLSYVFWPNHFELISFYSDNYFPLLEDPANLLDLGTGPGINTVLARDRFPKLAITGVDISPYAITMTRHMHDISAGRGDGKLVLCRSDATKWLRNSDDRFDAVVMAGLLEHLEVPGQILEAIVDVIKPGGLVFATTATHSAFYDHSTVFRSVEEIENLIGSYGFDIKESKQVATYGNPNSGADEAVNYFAILQHRKKASL